jgi:hypothetical protein
MVVWIKKDKPNSNLFSLPNLGPIQQHFFSQNDGITLTYINALNIVVV